MHFTWRAHVLVLVLAALGGLTACFEPETHEALTLADAPPGSAWALCEAALARAENNDACSFDGFCGQLPLSTDPAVSSVLDAVTCVHGHVVRSVVERRTSDVCLASTSGVLVTDEGREYVLDADGCLLTERACDPATAGEPARSDRRRYCPVATAPAPTPEGRRWDLDRAGECDRLASSRGLVGDACTGETLCDRYWADDGGASGFFVAAWCEDGALVLVDQPLGA